MTREPPTPEVEERLEAIAERYLEALRAGAPRDRGALLAANSDLAPWLETRLRLTEWLHEAAAGDEGKAAPAGGTGLRCPRCGHRFGPQPPPDEARSRPG